MGALEEVTKLHCWLEAAGLMQPVRADETLGDEWVRFGLSAAPRQAPAERTGALLPERPAAKRPRRSGEKQLTSLTSRGGVLFLEHTDPGLANAKAAISAQRSQLHNVLCTNHVIVVGFL